MNTDTRSPKAKGAAPAASETKSPRTAPSVLTLCTEPPRASVPERNPDPYNTSGSFDRRKNWAKVGKR